jgi:hypothetical protein
MFWMIATTFVFLWLVGLVNHYTMGGSIHLLLVPAVIAVLVEIIRGRRLT